MLLKGFHGTTTAIVRRIHSTGFEIDKHNGGVPSDLGTGVYFFIASNFFTEKDADNIAFKYALTYKAHMVPSDVTVVKAEVKADAIDVLDLDDTNEMADLIYVRDSLRYKAERKFGQISSAKAKERGNLDGIVLDLALDSGLLDIEVENPDTKQKESVTPRVILKSTYTSFKSYSRSVIPNGKEMAVRDLSLIDSVQ